MTGKSQSSLQIEVDGCLLYSASRNQKARAHSSGEAQYCASASAASEAMLIREVLLFTGLEVRTELLLDTAASRDICRREGVGAIRQLSTKALWPQQSVKRGVVTRLEHVHPQRVAQTWGESPCLPTDCNC